MSTANAPELASPSPGVQEALDAHVREIIEWHFNPETGCPFWFN